MPTTKKNTNKPEKQNEKMIWLMYILLALLLITYALLQIPLIGFFALILIILILFFEFRTSVKTEGVKKSIYDIAIALGAILVLWVILILVLHTTAPVDVVASCSMLPNLQRGDLVLIHGITNMSQFLSSEHVPVVTVSQSVMNATLANMNSEWLSYYAYNPHDKSQISSSPVPNFSIGLYNNQCVYTDEFIGNEDEFSECFVNASAQNQNLIKYNYSIEELSGPGGVTTNIIQTSVISINNTVIVENYSNPIVVYSTTSNDYFPKEDIIHRVFAAIHAGNNYYILTKGDNNPGLDIQSANYPANQSAIVGYVIGRVPDLGYLKLIISGQLSSPAGCNQTIIR